MTKTKVAVASAVLALAVSFLAYAAVQNGKSYYLSVDAFLADAQAQTQRVRLHGRVAEDGLQTDAAAMRTDFTLLGQTGRVQVEYRGATPDLFRAGADVVVEGRLGPSGKLQADTLLTKCASKYMPEKPSTPPGGPQRG